MLPAIELDGRVVTESDVVLADLEGAFGPLARVALDVQVILAPACIFH
jgi:glutathione S-transferase